MAFILIYLLTVIASIIVDRINYNMALEQVIKKDYYVVEQAFDIFYKKNYSLSLVELFLPFYNIFKSVYFGLTIPQKTDYMIDVFSEMRVLEPMNGDDIEKYEESPNPTTAKKIIKENEKQIESCSSVIFNDESIVYFNNNIEGFNKIKRVIGPFSSEDVYKQYDRVQKANELYKEFIKKCSNNSLTEEELNEFLKKPYEFDLSYIDDRISIDDFRNILNKVDDSNQEENSEVFKKVLRKK